MQTELDVEIKNKCNALNMLIKMVNPERKYMVDACKHLIKIIKTDIYTLKNFREANAIKCTDGFNTINIKRTEKFITEVKLRIFRKFARRV